MHAAVFEGARTVRVVDCDPPVPGTGQLRVRLEGSGVCGSNLPIWQGRPWFQYPLPPGAPGHEGWGTVDDVGPNVDRDWLGKRVTCLSSHAYAEWDVADVDGVTAVPPELDDGLAPGEPVGCAVNVVERAGIKPGDTVVVAGIGFLGAAVVALARHRGARVIAVSRRRFARELARELGADVAVSGHDPDGVQRDIADMTDGAMADVVVEATGLQETLDLASPLVRVRGRLVIAGYHQDGQRTVDLQLWNWRGLDVINAHERDPEVYVRGMREALVLAAKGVLPLDKLLTHRLPLDQLEKAFTLMSDRPDGFLKAVVLV
jgi:NADPH:quinone reductase